jgi:hypothetical protein
MNEMSLGQLIALGTATVGASFLLNWILLGSAVRDFRGRLERIERGLTGERGLQVRIAVAEEKIEVLEERRVGPADRREARA